MSQINVDTIRNAAGSGGSLSLSGGDFNFDSNTLFVDGGSHINGSSWAPDLGD